MPTGILPPSFPLEYKIKLMGRCTPVDMLGVAGLLFDSKDLKLMCNQLDLKDGLMRRCVSRPVRLGQALPSRSEFFAD